MEFGGLLAKRHISCIMQFMFTKTIYRRRYLKTEGLTFDRQAVRAVITDQTKLLMVYSTTAGDYKFPGGGVKQGETDEQALRRETLEEVGANVVNIGDLLGEVVEFDQAVEPEFDLFKMTSRYYLVNISGPLNPQNLDDYEKDLGFEPAWVEIDEAIRQNEQVLLTPNARTPFWTRRELYVLNELKVNLFQ